MLRLEIWFLSGIWYYVANWLEKLVVICLVRFHIQSNCHCNQLYDGTSSWWLQGCIFLFFAYYVWKVRFWFQRHTGSEGKKALSTCRLLKSCLTCLCREWDLSSTVEKDAENQILLYFVVCIVTEHIIVGRSGKACLPGISKIAVIDYFCCIRISYRHYESVLT